MKRARLGELKAWWGRLTKHDRPDFCFAWGGGGAEKSDGKMLCHAISGKPIRLAFPSAIPDGAKALGHTMDGFVVIEERSLLEELEARGYDLGTLRFTVKQRPREGRHDAD